MICNWKCIFYQIAEDNCAYIIAFRGYFWENVNKEWKIRTMFLNIQTKKLLKVTFYKKIKLTN